VKHFCLRLLLIHVIVLVLHFSRAEAADFAVEHIDSVAIAKVDRYLNELDQYRETLSGNERQAVYSIIGDCLFGKVAIDNFEIFHAFGQHRMFLMSIRGDSSITLADSELFAAIFGEHNSLKMVDVIIAGINIMLVDIKTLAVSQATRDLMNAWKDVRDQMISMSPLLAKLVDSGVLEKRNSPKK